MQSSRPTQRRLGERILETPIGFHLFEQATTVASDAISLLRIDVVALLHGPDAAHPRILVGEAAHHVVQQALAHGPLGDTECGRSPVLDDLQQDGETAGKPGARSASRRAGRVIDVPADDTVASCADYRG